MKRIKITLPKGGQRNIDGCGGSLIHLRKGLTYQIEAEEIIIEGDVSYSGDANTPTPLPFDLDAAKAGAPLVTRGGRKARFVGHVPEARSDCRVVAYIEGESGTREFPESGAARPHTGPNGDLCMATKPKRTVWINLYPNGSNGNSDKGVHGSEEEAKKAARHGCIGIAQRVEIDA